ncbi:RNA polymerase sigma-70 factor (ECF subfamily) [Arcticibacter tournemirensis]|uniref:Sigma-70 family RNA polymerase sigma factor n=1 Tax=Arcticibacter tournemirensis TaxID=699437 RepID=A0A4Q0M8F7_9SPHI|nr:sigma-70 family RNA polymerase sigma factor [Arcticibacter tournemirensis]KAA8482053.1 sigma-70 family RNA polymerase sigma factor [Arcticibacter tournemirensis]RXF69325.1 sigma-70 family RNA polymerase sigma factor [Arcticibacter tournemirensis]TQM49465.1 RNA polymerase sigma-70 factor (ECF subfamily) [Arcticibacter tournemirensis]
MKLQGKNDQELIHLYVAGHEAGLEELINRHKSKIYTSIYMLVKDQYLAEDIFQDTFIKVIKTLKTGKYNEEGKFLPWVLRIAHNLVIDYFRKDKRTPLITNGDGFDIFDVLGFHDESTEERMVREQTHKDLRKMIQMLPAEQKEVLIMRHYGDMSFKDIADVTQVSINTALGRMRYALNNLRKMLHTSDQSVRVS